MTTFVDSTSVSSRLSPGPKPARYRKPAHVLVPHGGFSRFSIEPGSYRDIRASAPLIAWATERPCATAADSPRLMQWIELSSQRHVRPALLREPRKRNANGKERRSACSTQSKASKTTMKTRGSNPRTLDSSATVSIGARHRPTGFPVVCPLWLKLSFGYSLACAARRRLQWPISAPMYGEKQTPLFVCSSLGEPTERARCPRRTLSHQSR